MDRDGAQLEDRIRSCLAEAWRLPEPIALKRTATGTNNATYRVDSPAGAFVAQVALNVTDPHERETRDRVLAAMTLSDVPFSLPIPLQTAAGAKWMPLLADHDHVLVLFTFIAGKEPDAADVRHVAACGRALAQLHGVLGTVDPVLIAALPERYSELRNLHTAEAQIRVLEQLELAADVRLDTETLITTLADTVSTSISVIVAANRQPPVKLAKSASDRTGATTARPKTSRSETTIDSFLVLQGLPRVSTVTSVPCFIAHKGFRNAKSARQ